MKNKKSLLSLILIGGLILGTVWFQGLAQTLPLSEGSTANPTSSFPSKSNASTTSISRSELSTPFSTSTSKTTSVLPKNTLSSFNESSQSYQWNGLTITLDNDGTLHIPGGTINPDQSLSDVLGDQTTSVKTISIDGLLTLTGKARTLFAHFKTLQEIDGLSNLDTSKVTDMADMFDDCSSLQSINLSSFNTTNVTDMADMFVECSSLQSANLSSFNTTNVTNMDGIFNSCSSLQSVNLSSFNTTNVTDMADMFVNCRSLQSLDLSGFYTPKLTDMTSMFEGCVHLKELDLSHFDNSECKSGNIFFNLNSIFSIKLGPKFILSGGDDLDNPPSQPPYTGKWQNVGTGTEDSPNGKNIWTAKEMEANYNGSIDADKYVWQKQYTPPLLITPVVTHGTIPAGNQRLLSGTTSVNEKVEVQEQKGNDWTTLGSVVSDGQGQWKMPPLNLPSQITLRMVGYDENNAPLIGTTVTTINAQKPDITDPKTTGQGWLPKSDATVKGTGQVDDLVQLQCYNATSQTWENAPEQKAPVTVNSQNQWEVAHLTLKGGQKWRAQAYRPDGADASVYSDEIDVISVNIPVITTPQITHDTLPAEKQTSLEGTGSPNSQLTLQKYVASTSTWEDIGATDVADNGKWKMPAVDLTDEEQLRMTAQFPGGSDSAQTQTLTALTPKIVSLLTPKHGENNEISTDKSVTFSGTGQADDLVLINMMKAGSSTWTTRANTTIQSDGSWSCSGGDLLVGESYQIVTRRPGGKSTATSPIYKIVGAPGKVSITNDNITINTKGKEAIDTIPVATTDLVGSGQTGDTIHLEYKDAQHTEWTKSDLPATTVDAKGNWTISGVVINNGVQWRAVSDLGTGVEETSNVIVGMSPTKVNFTQPKVVDGGIGDNNTPLPLKGTGQQNDIVQVWLKPKGKDWQEVSQTSVDVTGNWTSDAMKFIVGDQLKVVTQRPKGTETHTTGPYDIVHVINPQKITLTAPVVTNNTVPSGTNMAIFGIGQPGDVVTLFDGSANEGSGTVDNNGNWEISHGEHLEVGEHWSFKITHKYSAQTLTVDLPRIVDPQVVSVTSPPVEDQRLFPNPNAYLKGTGQADDNLMLECQTQGQGIWHDVGTVEVDASGHWAFQPSVNLVSGDNWKFVTNRPGGDITKELVLPIKGPQPQIPIIKTPPTYQKTITNEKPFEVSGTGQAGDTLQLEVCNIGQSVWSSVQQTTVTDQGTWTFDSPLTLPIGSQFKIVSSGIGWPDVETESLTNQLPQTPSLSKPTQTEGTVRPGNDIWQGTAGAYDYIQLQYQSEGSDTWENSVQVIANSNGEWTTPQGITTSGGESWRIIAYRPIDPTLQAISDTYFVVNGSPEKPTIDTPTVFEDEIPDDDNTIFSGTGQPGDTIELEYTSSMWDTWHLAPNIQSQVQSNGKFKLPPYSLVSGDSYRLVAHVPSYNDVYSDKWEAIAPDKLTSVKPDSSPLSSGNIDWSGKGQKYDFVFWQKYNDQNHTWEDQPGEVMVENGLISNTFKMTTQGLKEGDVLRLVTHRKGGQRRVYGSTYYVGEIYPKITGPHLTNKTIPTSESTNLTGIAQPNIELTVSSRQKGGDWVKVKTVQVQNNGEWSVEIGATQNEEELQVKDSNGEDSVTALDPAVPKLITPEHTSTTMKPQTNVTFSGTGQVDDQLQVQIRVNSTSSWETKGQTQVDAQGKWEVKGLTTLVNQEVRLVTQRPGGTKEAVSSTWTVIASNDYILEVPDLNITGEKVHQKSGVGSVTLLNLDGSPYTGSNQISVTIQSQNKGWLQSNSGPVANYYLEVGGQRLAWGKTPILLNQNSPSQTLEAYLESISEPKVNGKDKLEYYSVIK